jgi:hypothetical protein
MRFLHFNHLALVASVMIQWVLGVVWYSPLLFGKPWQALVTIRPEAKKRSTVLSMAASLVACLIVSLLLLRAIEWAGVIGLKSGAFLGFKLAVGFIAMPLFVESIYESRPFKLFIINTAYWTLALVLGGAVLSRWQ